MIIGGIFTIPSHGWFVFVFPTSRCDLDPGPGHVRHALLPPRGEPRIAGDETLRAERKEWQNLKDHKLISDPIGQQNVYSDIFSISEGVHFTKYTIYDKHSRPGITFTILHLMPT